MREKITKNREGGPEDKGQRTREVQQPADANDSRGTIARERVCGGCLSEHCLSSVT